MVPVWPTVAAEKNRSELLESLLPTHTGSPHQGLEHLHLVGLQGQHDATKGSPRLSSYTGSERSFPLLSPDNLGKLWGHIKTPPVRHPAQPEIAPSEARYLASRVVEEWRQPGEDPLMQTNVVW